jgi:hypothetical protein
MKKKIIGLSTGAFPREMDLFDKLSKTIDLNCDAVELMFDSPEHFRRRNNLGADFKSFLSNIQYLSIHLPLKTDYRRKTESLVEDVHYIGTCLGTHNYTVHPINFDFSLLPLLGGKASFENCRKRKNSLDKYKELYGKYGTKWVLDVSHALSISESHLDDLIEWHLAERNLRQIHLSNYANGRNHQPLIGNDKILERISPLEVPIILEASYSSLKELEKDLEYVRKFSQ